TNIVGGVWSDSANWDTHTAPSTSGDSAAVTNNAIAPFAVTNLANLTIGEFLLASPSATIAGNGNLSVEGLFTWQDGSFTDRSTLRAESALHIKGSSPRTLDAKTLLNTGAATWSEDSEILFQDGAILTNAPGATFDCTGNGTMDNGGGSNAVNN